MPETYLEPCLVRSNNFMLRGAILIDSEHRGLIKDPVQSINECSGLMLSNKLCFTYMYNSTVLAYVRLTVAIDFIEFQTP